MEFRFFPRGWDVTTIQVPQADGTSVEAMQLVILDLSGTPVITVFSVEQWAQFAAFVADPVAEKARAQARAQILGTSDMRARSIKTAKH